MRLNEISPAPGSKKARKRVGRGTGSGYGKTSGRGHKGAGARSGASAFAGYEGGQMPLQRRLPRLKGEARGRHTVARPTVYAPVNLSELSDIPGDTIGPDELRAAGLVRKKAELVKILGDGDVGRAVTVRAHAFLEVGEGEDRGWWRKRRGTGELDMLGSLANAWKIPELRTRLMFTFAMLAAYRLGAFIPLPGVRPEVLGGGLQTNNPITGLFGTFTGGAFNNFAVFSLGIMPYITAAIVMQLMTVAIPRLQELAKEGETGQQKITQYTRYFTLALALIQSVAMVFFFRSAQGGGALAGTSPIEILVAVVTLTAGVMLTMWFGELISQRGLGNGISLIITASILSQAPLALQSLRENGDVLTVVILGLLAVVIVAAIVFVNEGQRRIPITYAKRQVGRKMSQGGTTYLAPQGQHGWRHPHNLRLVPLALPRRAGQAGRRGRPELDPGQALPVLRSWKRALPAPLRAAHHHVHLLLHRRAVQPRRARRQPEKEWRLRPWLQAWPADGHLPEQRAYQDHALRRPVSGRRRGAALLDLGRPWIWGSRSSSAAPRC